MSSDKNEKYDPNEFNIASVGDEKDPDALIIHLPVKRWAKEGPDGMDMFYGKMRRCEAIGAQVIKNHWQTAQKNKIALGVVGPDGRPAMVS